MGAAAASKHLPYGGRAAALAARRRSCASQRVTRAIRVCDGGYGMRASIADACCCCGAL